MLAYLLCEYVDLGYHVVSAYLDATKAQEECDTLNARYRDTKLKALMCMPSYPYTEDQAIAFLNSSESQYFVDTVEVIE